MARTALLALTLASLAGLAAAGPAAAATTTTLRPVADSAVSAQAPGRTAGHAHALRIGPGGRDRAYLRFSVPQLDGPVRRVTLRLRAGSARPAGLDVYALSANAKWTERGLRYRNAPHGGRRVARTKRVPRGRVDIRLDVGRLKLAGGRRVNLAIAARPCARCGGRALPVASREVRSRAPRLLVALGPATIAAAGDIACPPGRGSDAFHCQQQATSDLLVGHGYQRILALGDNQYDNGQLADFQASFAPSWGRVKRLISPVAGNHEYQDPAGGAQGYFDYFNGVGQATGPAGTRGEGWYDFTLAGWHFIALNSDCADLPNGGAADGCAPGSPQETWLRASLAGSAAACTLVYWHHPRFSSGNGHDDPGMQAIWQDVAAAHADLVLNGHSHGYERFNPMNAAGVADPAGVQEIVVGTGGEDFFPMTGEANTATMIPNVFGVLRVTLHPGAYDWRFVPIAGSTASDAGSRSCH